MAYYTASSTERPTLPPLHSLHLPMAQKSLTPQGASYENYAPQPLPRLYVPQNQHRSRQVSISSMTSRSPSPPTPSSSSFPATLGLNAKVRLVPCAFDAADAIVVVSPPTTSMRDVTNAAPHDRTKQGGQALLLVGTALQQFRRPDRKVAKGARIHPYKIVRAPDAVRSGRT